MKLSARTTIVYSASIAGLLMLSACGKHDDQQPAPAAAATAPAPTAAPAAASTAPATTPAAAGTAPAAAPAVAAPAPTPAAASAAADSLKVGAITLGNAVGGDHKVTKAKTTFLPGDKSIYASVATEGSTAGATLSAKWTFEDGTAVSDISKTVSTDGPAVTTFKVANPNEWPEGKYKVVVSLNGQAVGNEAFEVKKK
jgi:hypothetical protein